MARFLDKSTGGSVVVDGFDSIARYQMVPLDGQRSVTVQTKANTAKLRITLNPRAILIGNFRDAGGASSAGLPGAGEFRNDKEFEIPANATIKFDIKGQQFANAAIDLLEFPGDLENIDNDSIIVGVKAKITKKIAFVFVSDVRGKVQERFQALGIDPRSLLRDINTSLSAQVNMELQDVDAASDIKELTIIGDLGDPIILDKKWIVGDQTIKQLLLNEVFLKFPRLFPATHFVILLTRQIQFLKDKNVLDVDVLFSTGSNVIFMTPFTRDRDLLQIALLHEVGHASGADHNCSTVNVMFPIITGTNKLFLAEHIEAIHHGGPIFPR